MRAIRKISFASVAANDGCICDRCGQHIQNIYTVEYYPRLTQHYGIDCFTKLCKSNLDKDVVKILKKELNHLTKTIELLRSYESNERKPEDDGGWYYQQPSEDHWWESGYWTNKPYSEYCNWMIHEALPAQIAKSEEKIVNLTSGEFDILI